MATLSTPNLAHPPSTSHTTSPSFKGLKKILTKSRRSSEAQHEDGNPARNSIDSLNLDRSPTLRSTQSSPSRDGSSKSRHDGLHKLIPGHSKRQRRRDREAELEAVRLEPVQRGRTPELTTPPPPGAIEHNRSTSSLLTEESETDTPPPLMSRDSHTGFFTTSSPLIARKAVADKGQRLDSDSNLPATASVESFPVILEPEHHVGGDVSPRSQKLALGSTPVLPSQTLFDRADTLRVERPVDRKGSISKLRDKSPVRKFRDVFSRSSKSPKTSPERDTTHSITFSESALSAPAGVAERRMVDNPEMSAPAPLKSSNVSTQSTIASPRRPLALDTELSPPKTPPSARLTTPLTTVTPPTPTDGFGDDDVPSPKPDEAFDHHDDFDTDKSAGSTGNTLGHRRVRSNSSVTHQKSKLSNSMTVPLTPTIEDHNRTPTEKPAGGRNFTANSGFFSSWVSAAQNAATSITNLTAQNRSRAGTAGSEPTNVKTADENEQKETDSDEVATAKKQLAVETLGSGSLDFSHLGLDASNNDKNSSSSRPELSGLRKKSDLQRDEAQARVEDILAKRAVSAAYEDGGDGTPVAEISDPVANLRHGQTLESTAPGTLTPSNGSIFEAEGQPVKRSNSVRSKLGKRRSRGSSVATGQSAVGTIIAPSSTTLASPSTGSRATGFAPAPKQRNRAFHQQFRSVPDDDNLIEDYSCALQKEILLAGRIYISEGHICFSSNILGWVTTLIISFEEIVSIEREHTAMIIPNAIAIQTLHARHTFRSLLSREATFDLMIGIWKANHPASFSKSVNGKQMMAEQAQHEAEKALGTKTEEEAESEGSSNEGSDSDDDEDDGSAPSVMGSSASVVGDELPEAKSVTRKPSGSNAVSAANGPIPAGSAGDVTATAAAAAGAPAATVDFPGPVTHTPTDCMDSATHYDKIIKDEVIPAPLGKIYSLLYGPQSGVFVRKYLVDECKCFELALDDDKKGLTNDSRSRQYSYIKPLGGAIGPKQTKCITTETLDVFDLEKSVSVTCSTSTPDVPSGNAFSTKTRYCLSWAPGNATRLQMNCTIEWSAKSWLKGPIEKGANDGQQQYGDGLVKALRAALGRSRGTTVSSRGPKTKKRKKGERKSKSEQTEQSTQQSKDWGILEPARSVLEPVLSIIQPVARMETVVGILTIMIMILWFGSASGGQRQVGYPGSPLNQVERLAAYEHLWQREEKDLWDWLEDRAGVNRVLLGGSADGKTASTGKNDLSKHRQKVLKDKSMAARLQAEKWSRKEMQEAVRVTRERLDEMQRVLDEKAV